MTTTVFEQLVEDLDQGRELDAEQRAVVLAALTVVEKARLAMPASTTRPEVIRLYEAFAQFDNAGLDLRVARMRAGR